MLFENYVLVLINCLFVSGGLYPVKKYVKYTYGTNPYFGDLF